MMAFLARRADTEKDWRLKALDVSMLATALTYLIS
jgi:hypothetical protein